MQAIAAIHSMHPIHTYFQAKGLAWNAGMLSTQFLYQAFGLQAAVCSPLFHCFTESHVMSERVAKLRRLEDLRRNNPHISASALSGVILDIEKHGLPELHCKKHVQEAREITLRDHTAYGPLLQTTNVICKDDSTKPLLHVNFLTLLQAMFGQGGGMTNLIKRTLERHPCSADRPWGLIFYNDEVVPGNVLSADTSRKVQCVYVSFKQFGPVALSSEESWFAILACRSSSVSELHAGMSQVTAALLKAILHPESCDPKVSGFLLKDKDGNTFRIHYRLEAFLQDGAAQKAIWNLKGDAGSKFCIFCQNLVTEKSGMQHEEGTDILVAGQWDLTKIQQATDLEIKGTMARLVEQSGKLNKVDFGLWQQAVGWNYNTYAMLHCPELCDDLKPVSQFLHDYMHCFLVCGIFQTIMYLLLAAIESELGPIYPVFEQCLGNWKLPAIRSSNLATLFSKKRQTANKIACTFKSTGSEALSLLPLICYILSQLVFPNASQNLKEKCNAFYSLTDFIDLIQLVPLGMVTPDSIDSAAKKFIGLCLDVGWRDWMHTKFHWCLHFGAHLRQHQQLPSCFVQERKHKVVKRFLASGRVLVMVFFKTPQKYTCALL